METTKMDEIAELKARIRRLEHDLESERAKAARERRTNERLALELYEARNGSKEVRKVSGRKASK